MTVVDLTARLEERERQAHRDHADAIERDRRDAYRRERVRCAEQRADMLEAELTKATRLLALAVKAAAGQDADPLTVLRVLEELDTLAEKPEPTIDELAQLLRETAP